MKKCVVFQGWFISNDSSFRKFEKAQTKYEARKGLKYKVI